MVLRRVCRTQMQQHLVPHHEYVNLDTIKKSPSILRQSYQSRVATRISGVLLFQGSGWDAESVTADEITKPRTRTKHHVRDAAYCITSMHYLIRRNEQVHINIARGRHESRRPNKLTTP